MGACGLVVDDGMVMTIVMVSRRCGASGYAGQRMCVSKCVRLCIMYARVACAAGQLVRCLMYVRCNGGQIWVIGYCGMCAIGCYVTVSLGIVSYVCHDLSVMSVYVCRRVSGRDNGLWVYAVRVMYGYHHVCNVSNAICQLRQVRIYQRARGCVRVYAQCVCRVCGCQRCGMTVCRR